MSNVFLERFREACARLDGVEPTPRPVEGERRYNVHQRSLPVGLDRPVAFFLTRGEADILMKRLKSKVNDDGVVIYYDAVPNTGENGSVFWNDGRLTRPEGSDDAPQVEIVRDWVG